MDWKEGVEGGGGRAQEETYENEERGRLILKKTEEGRKKRGDIEREEYAGEKGMKEYVI